MLNSSSKAIKYRLEVHLGDLRRLTAVFLMLVLLHLLELTSKRVVFISSAEPQKMFE